MKQNPINPGDMLLDKYRVDSVLGQGGMGFVVAARHVDLDELFAIKLMLPGALDDPDAERRFLREARASVRLKGEHAVRVHDVGRRPDGSLFMVMEHLVGTDLKTYLAERGPLPVEEAVSYALQACVGLGEAHDLGIVHRDLKPANLFLTKRRDGTPCIKVLDFGIAKQMANRQSQELTKSGTVLGSPLYMSPEQMIQAREVDKRSDLWSLGVVLYELLTGNVPFEGDTFAQVVYRVTTLAPLPPHALRPELSAEVDAVVLRCLEKDPDKRFESVDALAVALRSILGLPASTRTMALADTLDQTTGAPPPRPTSPSRSVDEHAPTQPGVLEAATGPATTAMSSSRDQMRSSQAQGSLAATSKRSSTGKIALGVIGAVAMAGVASISLRGPTAREASTEPSVAPAATSPAEVTAQSASPTEAPIAPASAEPPVAAASAPSPEATSTTTADVRSLKPAQPVPAKAEKTKKTEKAKPTTAPSPVATSTSSAPARSLY